MAGILDFLRNNNTALLQTGMGLLGGRTGPEQAAMGMQGLSGALEQNRTMQYLEKMNPQLAAEVRAGRPIGSAWEEIMHQRTQAAKPRNLAFQKLDDGTYGSWDETTGEFTPIGKSAKVGGMDDYSNRANAAQSLGLAQNDPRYQAFVLTGKMPREDQAPLTATDKKAILEADDMIAVNENAITALKEARKISDDANSGWLAGGRATIGNNLPDWMVPDAVSSPESSEATANYDNAVVGQALSQLKAIFGGAPTEGERKILLELQGSSNMPKNVRDDILDRAIAMAERRLEFNRQRATGLRGGDYYKPQGAAPAQLAPGAPKGNRTSNGVQWSVE